MQVNSCSWSPDDTKVVSCSADKTLRVWDVSRGEHIATLTGHERLVSFHQPEWRGCPWLYGIELE
jgi:WD40 repeat protein